MKTTYIWTVIELDRRTGIASPLVVVADVLKKYLTIATAYRRAATSSSTNTEGERLALLSRLTAIEEWLQHAIGYTPDEIEIDTAYLEARRAMLTDKWPPPDWQAEVWKRLDRDTSAVPKRIDRDTKAVPKKTGLLRGFLRGFVRRLQRM